MGCSVSNLSMLVPGDFIKQAKYFCVHQDPLIPLPGFLVIASLRHIQSLSEMQRSEYEEFSGLVRITHQAIKDVTKIEHLTIVQEEISPHFHLWFFPWTQIVLERYGQPSLTKIREIMTDYKRQLISEAEWKELERSIENIRKILSQ